MHRYLKLYWMLWTQGIQARIEYKLDFVLGNLATILRQATGIASIWIILGRSGDFNAWTLPEIMLIYGIAALPYGLFELFFNGLWGLHHYIRRGGFDRLLVQPMDALLFVLGGQPALHGLGDILSGIVIIVIASMQLGLRWNIVNLALLALMVICGMVIYISINTVTASLSFWFVGAGSSIMYLGQRIRDFTAYPIDIYTKLMQVLLTWIVPFAFASFYPATYFLGRTEYALYVYLLPVVTVAFMGIAYGVWRMGLNRYQSTGS